MLVNHHENVVSNIDIGVRFYESNVNDSGYVPFHWHSSIEIICVKSGKLVFQVNGYPHTVEANQFIIISSGVIHDVTNTPNDAYVLQVPIKFIDPFYEDADKLIFDAEKKKGQEGYIKIIELFDDLGKLDRKKSAGYLFDSGVVLLKLLKMIILNFTDKDSKQLTNSNILKDIIVYINESYNNKISVEELASKFMYNPSYLSRVFKQQTGLTIIEYVYQIRLSHLYKDLVSTELPVQELMVKNGLTNYRTSREMCKKMFGMLPKQIRESVKYLV